MWRRVRMYAVVMMAAATTLFTGYIRDNFVRNEKSYRRRTSVPSTELGANHRDREDAMYDFLENFQPKLDPDWELQYESYTRDKNFIPSSCPYGLLHRKNKSQWFESRYVDDIKIFMDHDDIAEDSFRKLQSKYLLPFGYKGKNKTAVEEIFSVLTHPPVWGKEKGRGKCVRCAVVGTGGQLKGSRRGREIDSHDYVFRLNHALVGSWYVKDVGNKTSFYIFFPESGHFHHIIESDPILIYIPFKEWDLSWMAGWLIRQKVPPPQCWTDRDPDCRRYGYPKEPRWVRPERLRLAHPDFLRYVFCNYLNSTGQRPTTGVFTAFMAVHMCDQVSMYGFGFDPRYPMHYYDADQFTEPRENDTAHNFGNERALWRILDRENIVRWVRR